LVIFGATGDLAFKKIFPALHAMVKRGRLDVPVVTVGREPGSASRIHERARASIDEHGGGTDAAAFEKLMQRLSYVGGDYGDLSTFAAIRAALGAARHPTFYLAIPPSAFSTVIQGLAGSGCAEGGRVESVNLNRNGKCNKRGKTGRHCKRGRSPARPERVDSGRPLQFRSWASIRAAIFSSVGSHRFRRSKSPVTRMTSQAEIKREG